MDIIKNAPIIKFLTDKDFKTRIIKLAIVLVFMCLGFISDLCVYISFAFCATFIAFEFSMDSILWVVLMAINTQYGITSITLIVMWEMVAILLIKFIIDLKSKRVNYKNWRFKTICLLFLTLCLLTLLPFGQVYKFSLQLRAFSLFAVSVMGLLYVKEVNFKQFFILIAVSVVVLSGCFYVFELIDLVSCGYKAPYSQGLVNRFSVFSADPNFTGAILICALACWFIAYKKKFINRWLYFVILTMIGIFLLMTISKATYLIVGLFGLFVITENVVIAIKTKNSKNLLELVWYSIVLLIACAICWRYLDAMYQRIFNPAMGWWSEGDNQGLSNFTTGRFDLWKIYLKAIFSSVPVFLFGYGTGSDYIGPGAAHSMPLDYLYRYGFLTTIILVAIFIIATIPYIKKAKVFNFVPLICITGIFCSIGSVSPKYIYIFVIMFLSLCCNGIESGRNKIEINNTNKDEVKQNKE